jgi:hypothetical protein
VAITIDTIETMIGRPEALIPEEKVCTIAVEN